MKRRVVIIDPYEAIRELLCRYLEDSTAYEVVGDVGTGLEAMRVLKRTPANVAIIDCLAGSVWLRSDIAIAKRNSRTTNRGLHRRGG
jgi:DNA-binding NarL/FixJ family response regulator